MAKVAKLAKNGYEKYLLFQEKKQEQPYKENTLLFTRKTCLSSKYGYDADVYLIIFSYG